MLLYVLRVSVLCCFFIHDYRVCVRLVYTIHRCKPLLIIRLLSYDKSPFKEKDLFLKVFSLYSSTGIPDQAAYVEIP